MSKDAHEWYESWFDTEYYHILYKNRDDNEAHFFIDNLHNMLNVDKQAKVLDLACGKGRHSIYLAQKGYDVTGVDLSENNITEARQHEHQYLHFMIKDMRSNLGNEEFDAIFNLFTSFGYFENERDNIEVLKSIRSALKPKGYLVLDYFNAIKAIQLLPKKESKEIDGIHFNIKKEIVAHQIIKKIQVNDMGHIAEYFEKVTAFTHTDFLAMFEEAELTVINQFGDYKLQEFNENSDRLVFLLQRQ